MTTFSTCSRCGRAVLIFAAVGIATMPHIDICRPDPSGVFCMQPAREHHHGHEKTPSNRVPPTWTETVISTSSTSGSLNLDGVIKGPGST
jgi:hypothetical protein